MPSADIIIISGEQSSNREQAILQKEEYMRGASVLVGPLWFIGWLFTIGYAGLVWWEILLAIVVWPLFLGRALV